MSQSFSLRIIRNFGFLTSGRVLGDLFTFVLFVALSRRFGAEGIGTYSFAMTLTGTVGIVAEFGLSALCIKEVSRLSGSLSDEIGRYLSVRLLLSCVLFAVFFAVLPFTPWSYETKLIIALLGVYTVAKVLGAGIHVVFLAREKTHAVAGLEILLKAGAAIAGISVIVAGGDLALAVAALAVAALLNLFVSGGVLIRSYGVPPLLLPWRRVKATIRDAVPHALSAIIFQINPGIVILSLGFVLGEIAVGVYSVSYKVVFVAATIPHFIALSLFPTASSLFATSKAKFRSLFNHSASVAVLLGVPAAAGLWLIAPQLIVLLYGESFLESAPILRLLSFVLLVAFLSRIMGVFLIAGERQVEKTRAEGIGVGVTCVLLLILIPSFGVAGAAAAIVISETAVVVLYLFRLNQLVGWPNLRGRVAISCIGVAAFFIPLTLVNPIPVGVVIPVAIIVYGLILMVFRETREHELRMVVTMLRSVRQRSTPPGADVSPNGR